jgi:hypothetical protein
VVEGELTGRGGSRCECGGGLLFKAFCCECINSSTLADFHSHDRLGHNGNKGLNEA